MEYCLLALTMVLCILNLRAFKDASSSLSARYRIRSIPRPRKLRTPILVPAKLLRPNRPCAPPVRWVPHAVIHNPILTAVSDSCETRINHAISLRRRVLVEYATLSVLAPVLHVHWVIADKFKLPETVVAVVGARGGVDDEILASLGVRELLGAFVGGKAGIEGAAVWGFLPRLVGGAEELALGEVGGDGPGVVHWMGCQCRGVS